MYTKQLYDTTAIRSRASWKFMKIPWSVITAYLDVTKLTENDIGTPSKF